MSKNNTSTGLIKISGIDALKFLQGQLTCDVSEINIDVRLGAHCNPQGRIISFFRIFFQDDSYFLQMPQALVPIALAALQKYSVFFKVTLVDASDLPVRKGEPENDLSQKIPTIYPETSEKFLPHELNLQNLNAISFTKGCYTGQEIIARMQYRGKVKTKTYLAKTTRETLPSRGSDIFNDHHAIGTLVDYQPLSHNEYQLLVLLPEQIPAGTLSLDQHTIFVLDN